MKSLLSPPGRRVAAGVAGILVAGSAAIVSAAPAQAAPATGELTWNISQQFVNHLFWSQLGPSIPAAPTGTVSGGATHVAGDASVLTDDYFTFEADQASVDASGTEVTVSYSGTVHGAFVAGGNQQYSVTVADPTLTFDSSGVGEITAVVSSSVGATTTGGSRVRVAEIDAFTPTGDGITATPRWENVLPGGSAAATGLGITDPARPVNGKAFHPEFLGALDTGVRAHFYYTASGDHKRPGDISTNVQMVPTVVPTVTSSTHADGVTIKVDGSGFSPRVNPSDDGVYVGIAPADAVIDFDDRGSAAQFAAVDWVSAARFTGDTFSTVLTAATDKLVPGKEYAIWTWQAHTHSNTTHDTKTPVAIDWATLQPPVVTPPVVTPPVVTPPVVTPPTTPAPVVKAKSKAKIALGKPRAGKTLKAVIKIRGGEETATGKVKVVVKRSGKNVQKTTLKLDGKGRAVLKVAKGKVKAGKWKVTLTYQGDDALKRVKVVKTFRVRR